MPRDYRLIQVWTFIIYDHSLSVYITICYQHNCVLVIFQDVRFLSQFNYVDYKWRNMGQITSNNKLWKMLFINILLSQFFVNQHFFVSIFCKSFAEGKYYQNLFLEKWKHCHYFTNKKETWLSKGLRILHKNF